jgi:hypothetical protein
VTPRAIGSWPLRAQVALWRHGWVLPLAVLLLAAAAALHWSVARPAQARTAESRAELQRALQSAGQKQEPVASTESQQVAALQAALASAGEPTELVRRMAALAEAEKIALLQSDYQVQQHASVDVVQLQVTQPVRASYPQLRRYVESVLRAVPNASLDQVSARRENVGQAQLETRLRWSIWIHKPARATPPAAPAASGPAMAASGART